MSRGLRARVKTLEAKTDKAEWSIEMAHPWMAPYMQPKVMEKLGLKKEDFSDFGWEFAWLRKDGQIGIAEDGTPLFMRSQDYLKRKFIEAYGYRPPWLSPKRAFPQEP